MSQVAEVRGPVFAYPDGKRVFREEPGRLVYEDGSPAGCPSTHGAAGFGPLTYIDGKLCCAICHGEIDLSQASESALRSIGLRKP